MRSRRVGTSAIGLGDEPFTADGPSNADLVARVASMAASIGREVASPREARDIKGLPQYEAGPVKEVAP